MGGGVYTAALPGFSDTSVGSLERGGGGGGLCTHETDHVHLCIFLELGGGGIV